ncbi:MAG: undecaprenyl/decaprenyl-phosphate alpha-N-acetylglucosaminyl 1-phosphate transferase [Planctomycetes bacterium]|nr:undecaprenyl/decaprenyl-phosphate alpha-N-acetylglucosaminyl 1-phosphate transferase [Planctomycetota bacterium]
MKTYLFTYCLSLLLASAMTPIVILWARRRGLVDKPAARKIHTLAIPRVGGIAIFLGAMLAILPVLAMRNQVGAEFREVMPQVVVLLLCSSALFIVGLYDDLKRLRIRTKLLVQGVGAVLVCLAGVRIEEIVVRDLFTLELGNFGIIVTILWIIGITNAVNLIDGLDGLAAGISGIASAVIAVLALWQGNAVLAVVMLALCGSLTGFLFFNFHPAKIFMGDSGSLFLGFILAVSSVMTAAKSEALVGTCLPIIVLGIPIFDTFFSVLRRYLDRRGIMSPDRGHFHHVLLKRGLKQHHVAMLAYAITALVSGLGFVMIWTRSTASLLVFLLCLALILMVFKEIGSTSFRRACEVIRERAGIAYAQRMEQKSFEEARLSFNNAETFEQWWQSLMKAGSSLDCTSIALSLETRNGHPRLFVWHREKTGIKPVGEEELIHLRIPVRDRRKGGLGRIEVAIPAHKQSIESAGRRGALFTRLIEEHGLETLAEGLKSTAKKADEMKTIDDKLAYP